ncbi:MAG: TetR/AcrR family transcriptional regulator [Rhodospirillales bacterium]
MAGLREQQKADRKRRILAAAEAQFREHGYEDTKIEKIAAAAGVSVGTVYNYVENKSDLLMILVTEHINFVTGEIDELIKSPPTDLVDGVSGVFFAMTRHSLDHLGKENWRHLFGLSIAHRDTTVGRDFAEYNLTLLDCIVRMLEALRENGVLHPACDPDQLGSILFRVETMHYIDLAAHDDITFEDYKAQLLGDLRFILEPLKATG